MEDQLQWKEYLQRPCFSSFIKLEKLATAGEMALIFTDRIKSKHTPQSLVGDWCDWKMPNWI